jgi:hypothetical protein
MHPTPAEGLPKVRRSPQRHISSMNWDLSMHSAWTVGWYRDAEQSRQAHAARDTEANAPPQPVKPPQPLVHDSRPPTSRG